MYPRSEGAIGDIFKLADAHSACADTAHGARTDSADAVIIVHVVIIIACGFRCALVDGLEDAGLGAEVGDGGEGGVVPAAEDALNAFGGAVAVAVVVRAAERGIG